MPGASSPVATDGLGGATEGAGSSGADDARSTAGGVEKAAVGAAGAESGSVEEADPYAELDELAGQAELQAARKRTALRAAPRADGGGGNGGGGGGRRAAAAVQTAAREEAEKEAAREVMTQEAAEKRSRIARIKKKVADGRGALSDNSGAEEGAEEEGGAPTTTAAPAADDGVESVFGVGVSASSAPPILVLCQTNHALDQFLEGILEFEPRVVRIGGRSQSEVLKKHNLTELLEKKKAARGAVERSARRNIGEELKRARDRLANAMTQLQQAWAHQPLATSLLRNIAELRGALGHELRRMTTENFHSWLCIDGAAELMQQIQFGAAAPLDDHLFGDSRALDLSTFLGSGSLAPHELSQHCNAAEVHYHRSNEQDYALSMLTVDRWRLHNALRECSQALTVRELEVALAHYRRLSAAVAEVCQRAAPYLVMRARHRPPPPPPSVAAGAGWDVRRAHASPSTSDRPRIACPRTSTSLLVAG